MPRVIRQTRPRHGILKPPTCTLCRLPPLRPGNTGAEILRWLETERIEPRPSDSGGSSEPYSLRRIISHRSDQAPS